VSEPAVLNWDRVIHKNARTSDNADAGNIIFATDDTLRIMQGAKRQYDIPKSKVEGFNGSEVTLGVTFSELQAYKVA
jgi:hypothetical protein